MQALVIDAYDSFVHIICEYLEQLSIDVTVVRNDKIKPTEVREFDADLVVLGPGPGHPADAGYVEIIREVSEQTPILGVCLGHQAIGLAFGGTIGRAKHLMHGKTSSIQHDGHGVFHGQPNPFTGTRYHSLLVEKNSVPESMIITATSVDDGYVMGLRHRELPIESVQFHPESILTERGLLLFENFIDTHVAIPSVA